VNLEQTETLLCRSDLIIRVFTICGEIPFVIYDFTVLKVFWLPAVGLDSIRGWFAYYGSKRSKERKVFASIDDINNTGLVEAPMRFSLGSGGLICMDEDTCMVDMAPFLWSLSRKNPAVNVSRAGWAPKEC
jgi:hypothetical protein